MVKGKLRESDPVPKMIPMVLPEDLLTYLYGELGLEIPDAEIEKYWKHAKEHGCPWANVSEGDHTMCTVWRFSQIFELW